MMPSDTGKSSTSPISSPSVPLQKPPRSIHALLGLTIIVPIVVVSVVLLLLSTYTSTKIESRLSSDLVESTTGMVRHKVQDSLRDARWISDLYVFRVNNAIVPETPSPAWERMMFASISMRPTLSSIRFSTPDGRHVTVTRTGERFQLCRSGGPLPGMTQLYDLDERGNPVSPPTNTNDDDVRLRKWFTIAMSSEEPDWTPVYAVNKATTGPTASKSATGVGYVRKMKREDGMAIGALSVDVSLETVTELLAESMLSKRGTLLVLDEDDQILSAAGPGNAPHGALQSIDHAGSEDVAVLRTALRSAVDPSNLQVKVADHYVSISPIRPFKGLNWRLAAIVPEDAVNTETTALQRNMAVAGIVCTAIALIMGLMLSRRIAAPIQSISQSVRRIGAGNFETPVQPQNTLELAQLAAAIEDMKIQLNEHVELRARNEALEHAAEARTAFFNRVTHELRTPLNAIIGYAEMLEEQEAIRNDRTSREDLRCILQASRQLLRVINDVLDLARTEAGRMEVRFADVPLMDLIHEVEETARPLCQRNRNAFGVFADGVEGLKLHTDPQKLKQILLNLLSNAAKFTRDGEVGLRVTRDNAHVCFCIRDTGEGIDPAEIPTMFEPFTQGDMTTEGSGLGLAISRQFTHLLGGEIEISSSKSTGTTVEVYFPVDAASIVRRAGEAAAGVGGSL